MAANSLFPAFVKVFYTTQFGQHVMTLPTLEFSNSAPGVAGTFETWDAGGIDGDTMVTNLVTDIAELYVVGEATFDNYEIFTMASPTAPPVWRFGGVLAIPGGLVSAVGWREAVQSTYTYRTSLGGLARLVLLDRPTANVFSRLTTQSTEELAISSALMSNANGWSGRDGGQYAVFKNQTITLNERLRREYGLG